MKESKVLVLILSVVFIAALGLIIVQPAVADETSVVISTPTGGDCFPPLGNWDADTKTCKLTEDIDLSSIGGDGITIVSDGITLLCNGYSITGNGSGYGILTVGVSGVTIKYCNVYDFDFGIYLYGGGYNTVKNNAADSNVWGIVLDNSNYNTVNKNSASNNSVAGVALDGSDNNTVNGNDASNTSGANLVAGILLNDSEYNTVNNNSANNNFGTVQGVGIQLQNYSDNNTVNGNNASNNSGGNFGIGIVLVGESNSNTVNNNTADGNSLLGYYDDSTDNTFKHDECLNNGAYGSYPIGSDLCSPQQP